MINKLIIAAVLALATIVFLSARILDEGIEFAARRAAGR